MSSPSVIRNINKHVGAVSTSTETNARRSAVKRISHVVIAMTMLSLILMGCSDPSVGKKTAKQKDPNEDDLVTVQHLLISFSGTGTNASRSKEEASELAKKLFEEAKTSDDFPEMIKAHTDDSFPGIYQISNYQVETPGFTSKGRVHPRDGLVPAFGNVGFALKVDEIGMAEFDADDSPFGWHIIKRIK